LRQGRERGAALDLPVSYDTYDDHINITKSLHHHMILVKYHKKNCNFSPIVYTNNWGRASALRWFYLGDFLRLGVWSLLICKDFTL
jgi:hypothetical protein